MGGSGGGVRWGIRLGGQGGCEVFVKIQKKIYIFFLGGGGVRGGGIRVDVNEKLNFL